MMPTKSSCMLILLLLLCAGLFACSPPQRSQGVNPGKPIDNRLVPIQYHKPTDNVPIIQQQKVQGPRQPKTQKTLTIRSGPHHYVTREEFRPLNLDRSAQ